MKKSALILMLSLTAACGGESENVAAPEGEAAAAKATPKVAVKFDLASLQTNVDQIALVPAPAEMQRALGHAGLTAKLAEMVTDKSISMDVSNSDQVAVRVGVVLADLVLTVETASKERMVTRLASIKTGLEKLGAGGSLPATIDDMSNRIKNDAVSRGDLLKEMDELSGVIIPELKYEAGDWVVPLVQAGSWLEGAHLVSGAITAESKVDSAGHLLRQPAVVDYFLTYVQREGQEKAPDEVVQKLEETLNTLKAVTGKSVLGSEEINTIHSATGNVLALL